MSHKQEITKVFASIILSTLFLFSTIAFAQGVGVSTSLDTPVSSEVNTKPSIAPVNLNNEVEVKTETRVDTEEKKEAILETKEPVATTVNTTIRQTAIVENLKEINTNVDKLRDSAVKANVEVKTQFETGIKKAFETISVERPDISPETLNSTIEVDRVNAIKSIEATLKVSPDANKKVEPMVQTVNRAIDSIEAKLKAKTEVDVSFTNEKENIRKVAETFREDALINTTDLIEKKGDIIFADSDNDGLSDYDELNIFNTDPNNAKTIEGDLTDGEKIAKGINPTDVEGKKIVYEDVKLSTVIAPELFVVKSVSLVSKQTQGEEKAENRVVFSGTAIPNSYVTLYVFSTPVIVKVKTNELGEWTYTMEQELEDGDHTIYVATVDNSGKVLAKSNPVPFIKTAEAASVISFPEQTDASFGGFVKNNLFEVIVAIFSLIALIGIFTIGTNKDTDYLGTGGPGTHA